jgi:hypothetical protein
VHEGAQEGDLVHVLAGRSKFERSQPRPQRDKTHVSLKHILVVLASSRRM